jgi:DNA polymerase-3 subunit gamma/tau
MNESAKPAYRVLARKYRPDKFSELIGQESLVRTLSNAIQHGRLAHAFVLTGVRGIGKTSTARLLAKGLNCIGTDGSGGETLEPCGYCEPCRAISAGRHVDVLEIDAASHTGVDDAREIIEGVGYRPISARYKIYIIDEVHMMSKSAFNALLKTLEEPPDAVKFVFATTEIRKVPVTILSRCQRYDLRRVPAAALTSHLESICQRESIKADTESLAAIARAAEGSVRDALSLLDQAAAMTADSLTNEMVDDMLGRPGRRESQTVLSAALAGDSTTALTAFAAAFSRGAEPEMLVTDMLDLVHQASMRAAGAGYETIVESEREMTEALSKYGISRLGRAWQLLLKGHGELGHAPNPAAAGEMLIIRLAHAAQMPTPSELLKKMATAPNDPPVPNPSSLSSAQSGPNDSSASKANATGTSTAATQPRTAANTQLLSSEPVAPIEPQITSLTHVVELAEKHDELLLAARIRSHVKLVSLQAGRLQISLKGSAPESLPGDIARNLSSWTGNRWLVSLSESGGEKTLAEKEHDAEQKLRSDLASEPLVAHILDIFPGATIDEVKAPSMADDNHTARSELNGDNEEMPG